LPSISTLHSKQTPIPQTGPRGSPLADWRVTPPVAAHTAAATVQPAGTFARVPSIVMNISSAMVGRDK
jgi:hypothetical protein